MARNKGSMEDFIRCGGLVKKRGSSSSSSSSILQNVKLKRAILAGRRGGSSTPPSNWKMSSETPPPMASSPLRALTRQCSWYDRFNFCELPTLWELQEIPTMSAKAGTQDKKVRKSSRSSDHHKNRSRERTPMQPHFLPPHLSDPSHSPSSLLNIRSHEFLDKYTS